MGKLELIQSLSGHEGRVWNVCSNAKGTFIASCGEDKIIRVWGKQGSRWSLKMILENGHKRTIREVAWSPCEKYLASASFDATITIWSNVSGEWESIASLEGHENEVKSVAWSNSGSFLASCSRDKSVWVWEVVDEEYDCSAVLNAHTQDVKKVVWHPESDVLASASYDNTVKIFTEDVAHQDWICSGTLKSHTSTVWSLSFDKTGSRLVTCSDDCTLKIWNMYPPDNSEGIPTVDNTPTWKCVCTLSGYHDRTIYDVVWCHLTGLIASACGDDAIRVFQEESNSDYHAPTFSLLYTFHGAHSQDVNCVRWNPIEQGVLASCSDDGEIKIWKYVD